MSNCIVVLNDLETYTGLGGCQLVELLRNEKAIVAQMDDGDDLAALDDYEEGTDFIRLDLEKIVTSYLDSAKMSNLELVAKSLCEEFDDVPDGFTIDDLTLSDYCRVVVSNVIAEVSASFRAFRDGES